MRAKKKLKHREYGGGRERHEKDETIAPEDTQTHSTLRHTTQGKEA